MPNYCIHLVLRLVSSQSAASEKVISHTGHWDLFVFHFDFNFFCLDQDPDPHSKPKCRSSLKCRLAKCCYFWLLAKGFYPEVTGADSRPFRCQQLTAPMGNCMNYNKLTPTGIHGTHEILETVWKFRFFLYFCLPSRRVAPAVASKNTLGIKGQARYARYIFWIWVKCNRISQ